MRILSPGDDPEDRSRNRRVAKTEWILDIAIPLALLKEKFLLRLIVGTDTSTETGSDPAGPGIRVLNRAILLMMFGFLAVTCAAGVIFLIYLIKSLAGIDIFPYEHLI